MMIAMRARCDALRPGTWRTWHRPHSFHPFRQQHSKRPMHTTRAIDLNTAWSPNSIDAAALAPQLFAASLLPYLVFLFISSRQEVKMPKMALFGFCFLLVFVGATIPAGIYAKIQYGTSLANVDWLHGSAESLLTVTNLLICLGLRAGIREAKKSQESEAEISMDRNDDRE